MIIKQRIGNVISNKMQKTIIVAVESKYQSPLYSKFKTRTKRYLVHDELNKCNIGDQVIVQETKPLSKKKCWVLKKILKKNILSY